MSEFSTPQVSHHDRKTGLVVFGVLTILLGVFCGLAVLLMFASQAAMARTGQGAPNTVAMLPAVATYAMFAVVLVWLGIGSVMARRWARTLLVIFSWSWLIVGVVAVGFMAVLLPQVAAGTPGQTHQFSGAAKWIIMLVPLGFMGVFFVILPGIWAIFYNSPHVKATCEARDPVPRWTDRCPLPVLAMSLWTAFCVPTMVLMAVTPLSVLPFFGMFLSGWAGKIGLLMLAALGGYAAWLLYRVDVRGWWLVLIAACLFFISHVITYSRHSPIEVYRLMGYTEMQIAEVQRFDFVGNGTMTWGVLVWAVPMLAFLFWVRKYFRRAA